MNSPFFYVRFLSEIKEKASYSSAFVLCFGGYFCVGK